MLRRVVNWFEPSSGATGEPGPAGEGGVGLHTEQFVEQFAEEVVNFSSQYGTAGTRSYTAENLIGPTRIFDNYGDFTGAMVLRTYGRWWRECPSAPRRLRKASETFRSQDFVELSYKTAVVPTAIHVYETYHPGAVVRILACNSNPKTTNKPGQVEWMTLWSGPSQCTTVPLRARKFSPPLKKIAFPTQLIRLEFNSEECGYYTELDAVELVGKPEASHAGRDRAEGFEVALTTKLIRQLSLTDRQTYIGEDDEEFEKWGYFRMLPDETIQYIFQFLDVVSLCKVAQTCTLLLKNAYDPLLYKELDLQSHWNTLDDVALQGLVSRQPLLHHLNLSWTGGGGQLTEQALCNLLEQCGGELLTLRLAGCRYVGDATLRTVGRVCTKLQELDLQSCLQLEEAELQHIGELGGLRRLNLYSMKLSSTLLNTIGRKCTQLQHLNIGASVLKNTQQFTLDGETLPLNKALIECIGNLKSLVSLDLWRCRFCTEGTLQAVADHCPHLEELDVGWCHTLYRREFDCSFLASKCTKLKKIFLTCGRTVSDSQLHSLAKHCPGLEQVDILGTNSVTMEGVAAILKRCPNMSFFDVSFCSHINEEVMKELEQKYPKVCFKKSFSN